MQSHCIGLISMILIEVLVFISLFLWAYHIDRVFKKAMIKRIIQNGWLIQRLMDFGILIKLLIESLRSCSIHEIIHSIFHVFYIQVRIRVINLHEWLLKYGSATIFYLPQSKVWIGYFTEKFLIALSSHICSIISLKHFTGRYFHLVLFLYHLSGVFDFLF